MLDRRDGPAKSIRCAIYTRKSTEEGLEQDFNSLDAQREACSAYILSQRHEGWTELPCDYEDGGFSGGNMSRPGLKRLLADIDAGKVDVIVVYKVDRLTRSLADFAKIVEVLDAKQASFVSVTQAFNTTSSMGRLTLNVLLSFAQFEREVTSERIRDKIAASKAKGMWMGGCPPLGYDVVDRKLIVNPAEADSVRHIFRRYAELGSVSALLVELDADGIHSKHWTSRTGRVLGGKPISRGGLYEMLRNRIYIGEVVHRGVAYPGQHTAIIDAETYAAAVRTLDEGRTEQKLGRGAPDPSLLAGMLWDAHGRRMSPSHTVKPGRRYRYYVSQTDGRDAQQDRRWRVSAPDIETRIIDTLVSELARAEGEVASAGIAKACDLERMRENVLGVVDRLRTGSPREQRQLLLDCVERIELGAEAMIVRCRLASVDPLLGDQCRQPSVSIGFVRSGKQLRLVIPLAEQSEASRKNPALIKLVAQAMAARDVLATSEADEFEELASQIGYGREHAADLLRIGYLAPDVVSAILDGRQPQDLTRTKLMRWASVPLDWSEQRLVLGF
ncbi:MAG: recombinase family protein [Pseudomonadota bacterium]